MSLFRFLETWSHQAEPAASRRRYSPSAAAEMGPGRSAPGLDANRHERQRQPDERRRRNGRPGGRHVERRADECGDRGALEQQRGGHGPSSVTVSAGATTGAFTIDTTAVAACHADQYLGDLQRGSQSATLTVTPQAWRRTSSSERFPPCSESSPRITPRSRYFRPARWTRVRWSTPISTASSTEAARRRRRRFSNTCGRTLSAHGQRRNRVPRRSTSQASRAVTSLEIYRPAACNSSACGLTCGFGMRRET